MTPPPNQPIIIPPEYCPCGLPLHYLSKDSERMVKKLVEELGESMPVNFGDRVWLVSRHYMALHGLKGADLPTLPHAIEICVDCRKVLRECVCMKEVVQ